MRGTGEKTNPDEQFMALESGCHIKTVCKCSESVVIHMDSVVGPLPERIAPVIKSLRGRATNTRLSTLNMAEWQVLCRRHETPSTRVVRIGS